jgi:hypothetical protein
MTRLGISISSDAVRGIVVKRGRVAWHARSTVGEQETIGAALERLLSGLPASRLTRPAVHIALGLAHGHLKRIERLPPTRNAKLLDRIVKENADAFFPRFAARTIMTDLDHRADGSSWAAAADAALLDEVLAALRRQRLAPSVALPLAAAIARAVPAGKWRVSDAGLHAELTTIEVGIIHDFRRRYAGAPIEAPPAPTPTALEAFGTEAPEFTAAYGVALTPARARLAWRPLRDPARVRALDVARIAAAAILLIGCTSAALFARGAHARRIASAAAIQLAAVHDSELDAARVDAELRKTTVELDRIRRFDATRGRMTALLGALSEALPESTALVSLRVDSLEGNLVALAPHAADVLPALLDLPGVAAPRIMGSVTREVQGGARVERAAIRFRRALAR